MYWIFLILKLSAKLFVAHVQYGVIFTVDNNLVKQQLFKISSAIYLHFFLIPSAIYFYSLLRLTFFGGFFCDNLKALMFVFNLIPFHLVTKNWLKVKFHLCCSFLYNLNERYSYPVYFISTYFYCYYKDYLLRFFLVCRSCKITG